MQPQIREGCLYKQNHKLPAASCCEIFCIYLSKPTVTHSSDKVHKLQRTTNDLLETSTDEKVNDLIGIQAVCHRLDVVNFVMNGPN